MDQQSQSDTKDDCFCGGTGPRFTRQARDIQSNLTVEHFRNAGIEFLKGVRSILDAGINQLSRRPESRGTTVNVD